MTDSNVTPEGGEGKRAEVTLLPVDFQGDAIWVGGENDDALVAIRPIVEGFGVDWSSQLKRMKRHPVMSKGMVIMTIPSPGGPQDAVLLRLHLLPGFLFGFDAKKVRADRREKLIIYQEKCFDTLYRAIFGAPATANPIPVMDASLGTKTGRNKFTMEEWQTNCRILREYRIMFDIEGERWMAGYLEMPIPPKDIYKKSARQPDLFDKDDDDNQGEE